MSQQLLLLAVGSRGVVSREAGLRADGMSQQCLIRNAQSSMLILLESSNASEAGPVAAISRISRSSVNQQLLRERSRLLLPLVRFARPRSVNQQLLRERSRLLLPLVSFARPRSVNQQLLRERSQP